MPSDGDLARSISELKDKSRSIYLPYSENLHKNTMRWRSSRQLLLVFRNLKRKATRSSLLNSEVLEHVQSASTALLASSPQVEKVLEELNKSEKKLSHCNKLILIADSSEQKWEVVSEYQRRDLADDSDDDKRIRQAEARASQKRRRAQLTKTSSSFRP